MLGLLIFSICTLFLGELIHVHHLNYHLVQMTQHFISSIGYSSSSRFLELTYMIYIYIILKALKLTMFKNNFSFHLMLSTKNATMYSGLQARIISDTTFFSFPCHFQSITVFPFLLNISQFCFFPLTSPQLASCSLFIIN